ncbi:MAG: hypothetical protein ACRDI2_23210 [Chloroflexota bacterium]
MASESETITVEGDGELARVLEKASRHPVLLEKDGVRYRVAREDGKDGERDDIWKDYDPQAVIEAMRAAAGSWSDIDAEAFKAYIRERRRRSSRPSVRL